MHMYAAPEFAACKPRHARKEIDKGQDTHTQERSADEALVGDVPLPPISTGYGVLTTVLTISNPPRTHTKPYPNISLRMIYKIHLHRSLHSGPDLHPAPHSSPSN